MDTTEPLHHIIRLDPTDNVATALTDLPVGAIVGLGGVNVETREPVGMGHKIALADIPEGESVRKYGAVIGVATEDIGVGDHVHVHNVRSARLPGAGE